MAYAASPAAHPNVADGTGYGGSIELGSPNSPSGTMAAWSRIHVSAQVMRWARSASVSSYGGASSSDSMCQVVRRSVNGSAR